MKAMTFVSHGKFALLDTTCLIFHRYKLEDIEEAYRVFENRLDGGIKIAVTP